MAAARTHRPAGNRTRGAALARVLPLAFGLLAACKSHPRVESDGGPAAPPSSAGASTALEPALSVQPPFVPLAAGSPARPFQLVAVGAKYGSKLLSMQVHGEHVWLSGRGIDAHADGDGTLVRGPDPLAGLPYRMKVDRVEVVGAWPDLMAAVRDGGSNRITVHARHEARWDEVASIAPEAADVELQDVVAWQRGALLVYSHIQGNAAPGYFPPEPGTRFLFVSTSGEAKVPTLPVAPELITWRARSDGEQLVLLGTYGIPRDSEGHSHDQAVHLTWGTADKMQDTRMFAAHLGTATFHNALGLRAGGAVVLGQDRESELMREGRPPVAPLWTVAAGKPTPLHAGFAPDCFARDLAVGDTRVFAATHCPATDTVPSLVSVPLGTGKAERLALPALSKQAGGSFDVAPAGATKGTIACVPHRVVLRGASDLWVAAWCGTSTFYDGNDAVPAVFRTGAAQAPIVLP